MGADALPAAQRSVARWIAADLVARVAVGAVAIRGEGRTLFRFGMALALVCVAPLLVAVRSITT